MSFARYVQGLLLIRTMCPTRDVHKIFVSLSFSTSSRFFVNRGPELPRPAISGQCDNYNFKYHEYVCITTYQPDTKSNPNPNPTSKQHTIVNVQLNIVACPTYSDKFIRDMLLHRLYYFRL